MFTYMAKLINLNLFVNFSINSKLKLNDFYKNLKNIEIKSAKVSNRRSIPNEKWNAGRLINR